MKLHQQPVSFRERDLECVRSEGGQAPPSRQMFGILSEIWQVVGRGFGHPPPSRSGRVNCGGDIPPICLTIARLAVTENNDQKLCVSAGMWALALQLQGVNEVEGYSHSIGSLFTGNWIETKRVNVIPQYAVQENVHNS